MHDPEKIRNARPQRDKEYEDCHFHDDDEVIPVDDAEPRKTRPPGPRKPNRRPPPRRRYEDD
jgi:hypothetical protein